MSRQPLTNGHMNGRAAADLAAMPRRKATPPPKPPPKRAKSAAKRSRAPKIDPDAARRIFAAQLGRRAAEAEWAQALLAGVGAGVIPDTAKAPEPVGTNRIVYADDTLQIALQVAAPMTGVNVPGLLADLQKAGVAVRLLNRLAAKHATETRPAHKFVCTPLG